MSKFKPRWWPREVPTPRAVSSLIRGGRHLVARRQGRPCEESVAGSCGRGAARAGRTVGRPAPLNLQEMAQAVRIVPRCSTPPPSSQNSAGDSAILDRTSSMKQRRIRSTWSSIGSQRLSPATWWVWRSAP